MTNDASTQAVWPTAREIARVIVEAARLQSENPISVAQGAPGARSRTYAYLALAHRFPTVHRDAIMLKAGTAARNARGNVGNVVRGKGWFDLSRLNAVNSALGWPAMTRAEAIAATLVIVFENKPGGAAAGVNAPAAEIIEPEPVDPGAVARHGRVVACAVGEPIPPPPTIEAAAAPISHQSPSRDETPTPQLASAEQVPEKIDADPLAAIKAKFAKIQADREANKAEDSKDAAAKGTNDKPPREVRTEVSAGPAFRIGEAAVAHGQSSPGGAESPPPITKPVSSAARALAAAASAMRPPAAKALRADPVVKAAPAALGRVAASAVLVPNGKRGGQSTALVVAKPAKSTAVARFAFTGAGDVTSFKPDAPLNRRADIEIMTAVAMGDPSPRRSALWERQQQQDRERVIREKRGW